MTNLTIDRSLVSLNPKFGNAVRRLLQYLRDAEQTGRTKTRFELYESFRLPDRQAHLLKIGATKAGPWQSAHQFGLAVDIVPYLDAVRAVDLARISGRAVIAPGWNWDASHDYDFLKKAAEAHGLVAPISWDRCHIEHPDFGKVRQLWRSKFE